MSDIPQTGDAGGPVFAPAGSPQNASYPCDPASPYYDPSSVLCGGQITLPGSNPPITDPGINPGSNGPLGIPTTTSTGGPTPYGAIGQAIPEYLQGVWLQEIKSLWMILVKLIDWWIINWAAIFILMLGLWLLLGRDGREVVINTTKRAAEAAA